MLAGVAYMSRTLVQWADMGARVAYMSQTLVQWG